MTHAINVEASQAYVEVAGEEARRRGHLDRINLLHDNFTDLAPDISPVDIVTLDRVICCYDDMPQLVELSTARANKLYGLVYPRDTWWVGLGYLFKNFTFWLQRTSFRVFLHPTEAVEAILRTNGWQRCFYQTQGCGKSLFTTVEPRQKTKETLGINQGLCWSTTVIMKIDLVGPKQRGLAMGLNEFAGYLAVSLSALATGYIAAGPGFCPARPIPLLLFCVRNQTLRPA